MSYVGEISENGVVIETFSSNAPSIDDAIEGMAWDYSSNRADLDPVSGDILVYPKGADKSDGIKARFREIPKDDFHEARMEIEHID